MLLTLGLYLFYPALDTWRSIQEEKRRPYELRASTDASSVSLPDLLAIDGVERVSPVRTVSLLLEYQEQDLTCDIQAVNPLYLAVQLKEGSLFPEDSSMIFLLLNEAAAKALAVHASDVLDLTFSGAREKAQVCGIYADDSETPAVYMAYERAGLMVEHSDTTELLLALEGQGHGEKVARELQKMGFSASFESGLALRWALLEQRAVLFLLSGLSMLLCAGILIRERSAQEQMRSQGACAALRLAGLTRREVQAIPVLRTAALVLICLLLAAALVVLTGIFAG